MDLSQLVDHTVLQVLPEMRLELVHQIFLELGPRLVLVTRQGSLLGMITKQARSLILRESGSGLCGVSQLGPDGVYLRRPGAESGLRA